MKRTFEVSSAPGKELSFAEVDRFVQTIKAEKVPETVQVKATVRFNGTLRKISCEWEDAKEDDAWLARQL